MTGVSDCGESSTTVEAAARRLNYLHDRRDLAARSWALLLFKCLDHRSYQIAWHVTAPQGDNEKRKGPSAAVQRLSRYQRCETRISRPVRSIGEAAMSRWSRCMRYSRIKGTNPTGASTRR